MNILTAIIILNEFILWNVKWSSDLSGRFSQQVCLAAMSSIIHKLIQLVEDPKHPSLGILLPILSFVGLWHPNIKSLKSRLKLFLIYITIAFLISQYVKCILFFSMGSLKLILQYAPFHLGIVKTCFFHKDYKFWNELVKYISSTECKQSMQNDEEQNKIIKAYIRWSRSVTYFFIILAFFADISLFAEPYQHNQVTENSTVYVYIFDGYTPFGKEPPGYYYSMAIQTVFGYVMSTCIVVWDMTTVTIMIFFVGQLRLCSLYCSRVIEANVATSQKNIAECHEFHTTLVLYQKKFNALISPVMFLYVIIVAVNLGVCIKQIAEVSF